MITVPVAQPARSSLMGSGLGFDWGELAKVIGASTEGTAKIILANRDPFKVPGTDVIYTPATGKIQTTAGVTATGVGWGLTPLAIAGGIGLVLLLVLMKR